MIGSLFKDIRINRSMSQYEASLNSVSLATYRKIEKEETDISFANLIQVLDNLNLTVEEFIYIWNTKQCTERSSNPLNKLKSKKYFNDSNSISQLINEQKDITVIQTLECIRAMHNKELEKASEIAGEIWSDMKNLEKLYPYDLLCLTHIFMAFDTNVLGEVKQRIKKDLINWRDFEDFHLTEITFHLNLGKFYEVKNHYESAIENYQEALDLSVVNHHGLYTGAAMYRLGQLEDDLDMLNKAEVLLKTFDSGLYESLKSEY